MNLMTPFLLAMLLIAVLPAASVAQSQSGVASGVSSVAIPKTTEDGSPVHSRRTLDAAKGTEPSGTAVTRLAIALPQAGSP